MVSPPSGVLVPALIGAALLLGCKPQVVPDRIGDATDAAWQYYRTTDYPEAATRFRSVLDNGSSTDPQRAEALFGLASLAELKRPDPDPRLAAELYQRLLRENPGSAFAPWGALAAARMTAQPDYNREPDRDAGVKAYQAVMDQYPGHLASQEAFLRQQVLILASGGSEDARGALAALQKFSRENPDSPFLSTAYWTAGSAALAQKDYRAARDNFQWSYDAALSRKSTVLRNMYSPIDEASTLYSVATLSEFKLGDLKAARESCQRLIRDFPRDWRAFSCRQALLRMDALEAGGAPVVPGVDNQPETVR